jgi:hypothetical protein
MRTWTSTLLALCAILPLAASADAFTDRFVAALKRAQPGGSVRVVDANELEFSQPGSAPRTLFLDQVRRVCAADQSGCAAAIDRHIRILLTTPGDKLAVEPSRLRVIYRHREYVAHAEKLMRDMAAKEEREGKPPRRPLEDSLLVWRPWQGNVVQIIAVDYPDRTSQLGQGDLRDLGLGAQAAFAQALAQTEQEVAKIEPVKLRGSDKVFLVGGSYYASSLFETRAWRDFAARERADSAQGCLAAAELVAVAVQPDAAALDALRRVCRAIGAREPRPISPEIFEWRAADGWRVVAGQ